MTLADQAFISNPNLVFASNFFAKTSKFIFYYYKLAFLSINFTFSLKLKVRFI